MALRPSGISGRRGVDETESAIEADGVVVGLRKDHGAGIEALERANKLGSYPLSLGGFRRCDVLDRDTSLGELIGGKTDDDVPIVGVAFHRPDRAELGENVATDAMKGVVVRLT
ncbi:MAG: hypothetical protein U0P48_10635 [Ancrocorticia sp.]